MNLDLRLYLVTQDTPLDDQVMEMITAAISGGVTMIQLRHKQGTTATRVAAAQRLAPVLAPTGVPLIVNDDVEAAHENSVAGIHVGPDDPHPAKVRQMLGPNAVIGWSIHDFDQLSDTAAVDACDYFAASPVWPTSTKADTTTPMGLDGVRALRAAMPSHLPLIGIGGITAENAGDLIRAGADGAAVVSAILSDPDPATAARSLREVIDAALTQRAR